MELVRDKITDLRKYFPKSFDPEFEKLRSYIDETLVILSESTETVGQIKGTELSGLRLTWNSLITNFFADIQSEIHDYVESRFPTRRYSCIRSYKENPTFGNLKFGYAMTRAELAERKDGWWNENYFDLYYFDWDIKMPDAVVKDPMTKKLVASKRIIKANNLPEHQRTSLIHTWKVYIYEKYFLPLAQEKEKEIKQQFKQKKDEVERTR